MSSFLESLVLRAAGLPPAASPAPSPGPPHEPLEAAGLEEIEEETSAPQPAKAPSAAPAPQTQQQRVLEVQAEPRTVVGQQTIASYADPTEQREPATEEATAATITPTPRPEASLEPPTVIQERERDVIRERLPIVQRVEQPPIAQPLVPQIAVPRETLAEQVPEPAGEHPAITDPVVLQPIVIEQTNETIQSIRERERIVETRTHTDHTIETKDTRHQDEPDHSEPTTTVPPPPAAAQRATRNAQPSPAETQPPAQLAPTPAAPRPPATSNQQRAAEPPTVLVQPQPPAPPPQIEQQPAAPEWDLHIGTIEIRGAAPPPPPPAPAPAPIYITREADSSSGFDDYARVRSYGFPDVW